MFLPLQVYFHTLSPLVCVVFNPIDDSQLSYLYDDNLCIEPEWYCPVLPGLIQKSCTSIGIRHAALGLTISGKRLSDTILTGMAKSAAT